MRLTVLNVAYPLAPVGPDASGGAEQVLTQIDRALVREGHTSVVIACEGSQTAGTLCPALHVAWQLDAVARRAAHEGARAAIRSAMTLWNFDVIHLHGVDFDAYLPPAGPPALATLHLPPAWYPAAVFRPSRPDTWLVCVSKAQRRDCPPSAALLPPIGNGVPVEEFERRFARRDFALALGRVCPEKGYHLALDAAAEADAPLLLAGEIFHYPEHEEYFEREIAPRLDRRRRFLGPVGLVRKRRLLGAARCLLIPSLVAETSSLTSMEALASGTPVVAFRSGALPEIVEHERTGFLVDGVSEMADAMRRVHEIDPETCRAAARERFSADRMASEYLALYEKLARSGDIVEAGRVA
jgi:glycosyltransferase involved in cell wall biosynthesis